MITIEFWPEDPTIKPYNPSIQTSLSLIRYLSEYWKYHQSTFKIQESSTWSPFFSALLRILPCRISLFPCPEMPITFSPLYTHQLYSLFWINTKLTASLPNSIPGCIAVNSRQAMTTIAPSRTMYETSSLARRPPNPPESPATRNTGEDADSWNRQTCFSISFSRSLFSMTEE